MHFGFTIMTINSFVLYCNSVSVPVADEPLVPSSFTSSFTL